MRLDDDAPKECFRVYKTPEESYRDHSKFLKNGQRYAFLFDLKITDYKAWAKGLKKAGYATLPTYATTGTAGTAWAIVGDFGRGALANFPNGQEVKIKFDDLSLAEKDLVKIVGREFVGLGIVADHAFCKIVFPS